MVVVDANVLLYAVDRASAHHERSRTWLDASLAGGEAVASPGSRCWRSSASATNPSIRRGPMSADEAMGQVEAWLAAPAAVVAEPTSRHASVLRGLLRESGTAGNLTTDAHLAALAIEHGADIVSFDRDFARFRASATGSPGGPKGRAQPDGASGQDRRPASSARVDHAREPRGRRARAAPRRGG